MGKLDFGLGEKAARTMYPLFVGNALGVIIAGLKIIVATRLLGPGLFGVYVFIVSYYSLIGSVNDFGIASYFKKYAAELSYRNDKKGMQHMLSAGLLSIAVVSLLLAVFGIIISGSVASLFGGTVGASQVLLELGSLILFTTIMFGSVSSILIGLGNGAGYSISYLAYMAADFIITVYALLMGYGVLGILIGTLAGSIIGLFASMYFISRHLSEFMDFCPWYPKLSEIRRVFRFAYPLAINNVFSNSMQNFSVILLGFFVSGVVIGNYGTALKGLFVLGVFYGSVVTVLLPVFSEAVKRNKKKAYNEGVFNASVLYSVFVTVPVLLYFAVFSKQLIYIFIGSSYELAPAYLALIAIGTILGLIGSLSSALLVARGMTRKILKYGAVSALLQLASMLLLVPHFGVIGAIVGIFFIGSVANTVFFTFLVIRIFRIRLNTGKLARLAVAAVASALLMLVPLYAFGSIAVEVVSGLVVLFVVYPAAVMITRAMDKEELEYFKKSTGKLVAVGPVIKAVCRYMDILGERIGY